MAFEFSTFFGRFHPLFVHLPIGIILITLLLERFLKSNEKAINLLWVFSFLSAFFAIFSGWQLAKEGSYPESLIFSHKWLGVSIGVISLLIYILNRYAKEAKKIIHNIFRIVVLAILIIGGHKGGQLTHGDHYLIEASPGFIKKLVGFQDKGKGNLDHMKIDSIETYEHLVMPIIKDKCIQCHTEKAVSGGLVLDTYETLILGGTNGEVVIGGDALESELFKRVALEKNNVKFMPPRGNPMSFHEMEVLSWWIENGAAQNEKTSIQNIPENVIKSIFKLYNIDLTPRPWFEKEKGPAVDSLALNSFASKGYKVVNLSDNDNYLELKIDNSKKDRLKVLKGLEENIILADLRNTEIDNTEIYASLSNYKNLIRLQLQGTNTNNEDILKIKPLPRLESINLFGTKIDDEALIHLSKFPSLKRIYTWQTGVTEEGILKLNELRNDIEVNNGI